MDTVLLYGFLVGLFFGYILQRGRVCYNSAIRDVKFFGDNFLIKAVAFSVGLNALFFTLMARMGVIQLVPLSLMAYGEYDRRAIVWHRDGVGGGLCQRSDL